MFTDQELAAATEAVLDNILKPMNLQGIAQFVAKDVIHGFVQRECANALTAAARVRSMYGTNTEGASR